MTLPTEYDARKEFPLMTFLTAYFPDTIEALVALSIQGNVQHKIERPAEQPFYLDGDRIAWDRTKSKEELETMMRHAWDHTRAKRADDADALFDSDGHLHIIKTVWRAAAEAQKTIEMLRQLRRIPLHPDLVALTSNRVRIESGNRLSPDCPGCGAPPGATQHREGCRLHFDQDPEQIGAAVEGGPGGGVLSVEPFIPYCNRGNDGQVISGSTQAHSEGQLRSSLEGAGFGQLPDREREPCAERAGPVLGETCGGPSASGGASEVPGHQARR